MNGGRSTATGRGRDGTDACRVGRADGRKFCLRFNDSASIRARSLSFDALSLALRSFAPFRPAARYRHSSAHPPGTPHASNCPHACMHARTHARAHARTHDSARPTVFASICATNRVRAHWSATCEFEEKLVPLSTDLYGELDSSEWREEPARERGYRYKNR